MVLRQISKEGGLRGPPLGFASLALCPPSAGRAWLWRRGGGAPVATLRLPAPLALSICSSIRLWLPRLLRTPAGRAARAAPGPGLGWLGRAAPGRPFGRGRIAPIGAGGRSPPPARPRLAVSWPGPGLGVPRSGALWGAGGARSWLRSSSPALPRLSGFSSAPAPRRAPLLRRGGSVVVATLSFPLRRAGAAPWRAVSASFYSPDFVNRALFPRLRAAFLRFALTFPGLT